MQNIVNPGWFLAFSRDSELDTYFFFIVLDKLSASFLLDEHSTPSRCPFLKERMKDGVKVKDSSLILSTC
jgi:hypothetical protein